MSMRPLSAAPAPSQFPQPAAELRRAPGALLSSSSNTPCAAAVRRAIELLSRASADWRNGDADRAGELHWPVSVNLARRALREALEALEPRRWPAECANLSDDARAARAWFNSLSPGERRHWLETANSAIPADAWVCYKAGISAPV